jgi:glycosyltransferase involved in cell wall biosynthesis
VTKSSGKFRVLYFCSRLPSTVQGGLDLRIRGQIAALLGFADVSVFALAGNENKFDPRIRSWRASKNRAVSREMNAMEAMASIRDKEHPFRSRFSEETAEELREEIRLVRPDCIVVSRLELAIYLETIKKEFDGKLIFDLDESVASSGPSILKLIGKRGHFVLMRVFFEKMRVAEEQAFCLSDEVWVSSDVEREQVKEISRRAGAELLPVQAIPNVISVDPYIKPSQTPRDDKTIIYPASFGYEPNVDAAKFLAYEVMPLLPSFQLRFVGSHMPVWLRKISIDNISCEGPVDSIVPYLKKATVIAIPLRAGGGTRLKAIEALAAGLPVVSSAIGVEGLNLIPEVDYLPAESADDFSRRCRLIADDKGLALTLAENGQSIATSRFSTEFLETRLRSTLLLQ